MASPTGEIQLGPIPTGSKPLLLTQRTRSASSDRITTVQDLESGSLVCCRICLENDGKDGDELISPCLCKGTQEFVHRHCLDHWRSVKEGFSFSHCTTCKAQFEFRVNEFNEGIITRMKLKLFVVKDVFRDFLITQTIIAVIGGYVYLMDNEGTIRNAFNDHFGLFSKNPFSFYYCMGALGFLFLLGSFGIIPYCISLCSTDQRIAACQNCCFALTMMDCLPASTVIIAITVVFVLFGIAYGFFASSMAVQRSWHRHYQLLAKRNLTQVYVVVDQHGHYTPPKLDRKHEERLRALNLL